MDLRAVATLRILSALLVIASLVDRLASFSAFYSDAGVLSEAGARNCARFEPWDGVSWLHPFWWLPDPWGSTCLFVFAGVAALFLLVGKQARVAGLLTWLMLTAIDNRNPLVLDGGDDLLRMLLFWGLFLPLSARWSIDARSSARSPSQQIVSIGTAAFLAQIFLVYFASACLKSYRDWVIDGSALHYALRLEQWATPLGVILRDSLPLQLLSRATWWLELVGPVLLFSPLGTDPLRYLLFFAFSTLHLGIGLTLGIWLFGAACIAGWVVALPSPFWERVERILAPRHSASDSPPPPPLGKSSRRFANEGLAALFLAYVVAWNVWALDPGKHDAWFPFGARWLGYQLRVAQLWGMFSPAPARQSSWLELRGEIVGERPFSLLPDGRRCESCPQRPERLLTERWRKFQERVVQEQGYGLPERYAKFLLKRLEDSSTGASPSVSVSWLTKPSPPPRATGSAERPAEEHLLARTPAQNQANGKSPNRPDAKTSDPASEIAR